MRQPLDNWDKIKRGYKFGERTFYGVKHLGVDYVVPINTPVFASTDCEIILSQKFIQGGNTIWVLWKDGLQRRIMRCLHLKALPVKGKYKEGQLLAYTGNSGLLTTAPHVHIDISRGSINLKDFNNFIDPDKYFSMNTKYPLVKVSDSQEIYVVINEYANHIINLFTFFEGKKQELWEENVKTITQEEFNKYKKGVEISFTPS